VKTFERWITTSYTERAALLHKVAFLMREKRRALAGIIATEMGKLIGPAEQEIMLSADIFDYCATHGARYLADKMLSPASGKALIRYSPIGVLLGIAPCNFPFYEMARFTAPNLMIGNTMLVKHAFSVPQCDMLLEELFTEAGAPKGLYTILQIADKRAAALVADDRIKGISLTGGEAAEARIATETGKHLKKSVLELGSTKLSGYGCELLELDSDEFVNKKLVRVGEFAMGREDGGVL